MPCESRNSSVIRSVQHAERPATGKLNAVAQKQCNLVIEGQEQYDILLSLCTGYLLVTIRRGTDDSPVPQRAGLRK